MNISAIESAYEVQQTARVLLRLVDYGLKEPAVAAGYTRSLMTGTHTADIDVSYVGDVPYQKAQNILRTVLDEIHPDNYDMWDIEGIWNTQAAYGVEHTVENFLLYYLNSVDSIYLAADGHLHDPTGYGFHDATYRILRINEYDRMDVRIPTATEEVNVCLENCRRIAKFGWRPTPHSIERIKNSIHMWEQLDVQQKDYFTHKLSKKYQPSERKAARAIYHQYGWGFVFDL